MAELLGDDLEGHLLGEEQQRARMAQLVNRPVAEARLLADLGYGSSDGFGAKRRSSGQLGDDLCEFLGRRLLNREV